MKTQLSLTLLPSLMLPAFMLPALMLSISLFSTAALADQRANRDHDDYDRDRGYSNRGYSDQQFDNRDHRPNRYRRDRDTDVSVNLIISNGSRYNAGFNNRYNLGYGSGYNIGYNSIFNTFGYGVGYSTFGGQYYLNNGYPYRPMGFRNNRPVVIEHNTYISQPIERSGVTTYSNRASGTSLLRDLQGRCFERVIDRNGNEIRTELDPSECDF